MAGSFPYKNSQGGLGMFPVWQMATSQLALTYAFPGYLGGPAMQGSTERIQFPLPWSHPYRSRSCLMNRQALVPALAVRLPGRIPKSSNMRTACSETRHRWQNKSNAIFFQASESLSSRTYEKLGHFSWIHVSCLEQRRYRQPLPENGLRTCACKKMVLSHFCEEVLPN